MWSEKEVGNRRREWTLQICGTGFTKSWEQGSADSSQIIHKVWGKVERDETGKVGYNQIAKGLACKIIRLGISLRLMCSPIKYISRKATW